MRRRLVLVSAATTVLLAVAFLVPLMVLVQQVAQTRAMARGTADADTVVTVLLSGQNRNDARLGVEQVNRTSPNRTTVFFPDHTQLGAPAAAGEEVQLAAAQRRSFDAVTDGGRAVYVPVELDRNQCCVVVRTFVPEAQLHAGVATAWGLLALLTTGLLVLALVVAVLLASSLVQPLLRVARVADQLQQGDLEQRAEPGGPAEIRRIGEALNRLADRILDLLQAERETVADLSHRVRTPLTALRLDIDGLTDPEEAERLAADADEIERSVNHVIHHARTPIRRGTPGSCDLEAVTAGRIRFWAILAEEQGRAMRVELPGRPVPVPLDEGDLAAVVDALLGNVLSHTPPGTAFGVEVRPGPPAELVVSDSGPGLADPALVERGRSGGSSTGLGLDIVRRTAERTGGRLTVAPAHAAGHVPGQVPPQQGPDGQGPDGQGPDGQGPGLRVVVTLGPARRPSGR